MVTNVKKILALFILLSFLSATPAHVLATNVITVENTTASDISIDDMGKIISANTTITLTETRSFSEISESNDLSSLVNSGSLILGDGIANFSASDAVKMLIPFDNSTLRVMNATSGTRFIVDNEVDGKVGINIETPISTFHISEDTTGSGAAEGLTIEHTNLSGAALLHFKDRFATFTMGTDFDDNSFYITPGLLINPSLGLNIDRTTGFTSIGNVTGGPYQLNVAGNTNINGVLTVTNDLNVASGLIFADVSNGTVTIGNSVTGTDRFNVFGGGFAGVQTGIAAFYNSAGALKFRLRDEITGSSIPPRIEADSALGLAFNTVTDAPFVWYVNGTANEKMRLTSTGLGIGADPVSPLHISENTNTTGVATGVTIEQTNSSGEALLHFKDPFSTFTMGMDTSDDNAFYITPGTSINVSQGLNIDRTTGFVSIGAISGGFNQLNVAGDINTTTAYNIGLSIEVLNATTLGSGVVNSSLTSVGTLTSLDVNGLLTIADPTGANSLLITGASGNEVARLQAVSGATNRGELLLKEGVSSTALVKFTSQANESNYINNGGNLGLGTLTPDASALLDLASTTQGFGIMGMTNAEILLIISPKPGLTVYSTDDQFNYQYDSSRSKWLSSSDTIYQFGSNGTTDNNELNFNSTQNSTSGVLPPRNGTVISVTGMQNGGNITKGFEVRSAGLSIFSYTLVASKFISNAVNADFLANDAIHIFAIAAGGATNNPTACVTVRWRL